MIFSYLKYDKLYFTKTCVMSKYETPPDLKIIQFQGRDFLYTNQIILKYLKYIFIKFKTFDISDHIKVIYFKKYFYTRLNNSHLLKVHFH